MFEVCLSLAMADVGATGKIDVLVVLVEIWEEGNVGS